MISCVGVVRRNCFAGFGERVVRDQRGDVAQFRRVRFSGIFCRGNAVENIGDADGFPAGRLRVSLHEFPPANSRAVPSASLRRAFPSS